MLTLDQIKTIQELKQNEHWQDSKIAQHLGISIGDVSLALERSQINQQDIVQGSLRASSGRKSLGKAFVPFVRDCLQEEIEATSGDKSELSAGEIYLKLKEAEPPFLGKGHVSKRTIERVVKMVREELQLPQSARGRKKRATNSQSSDSSNTDSSHIAISDIGTAEQEGIEPALRIGNRGEESATCHELTIELTTEADTRFL